MKDYVNMFFSILDKIDKWENLDVNNKITIMADLMNIKENNVYLVNYFDKYVEYLLKNPLKNFTKDILETKF